MYLLILNWLAQVAGEDINFDTFCTGAARRRGFRLESTFPAVVCQLGAKGIPRLNSLPPEQNTFTKTNTQIRKDTYS